ETSRTERYETSKLLFRCRMTEGSSASAHAVKMLGYIEKLGQLGFVMDHELSIDLVLQSLPESYSQFVLNFYMNKLDANLPELVNMLKTAEPSIHKDKKNKDILVVGSSSKGKAKMPKKEMAQPRQALKPTGGVGKAKDKQVADKGICHHCGK